jgi:hypothetical protein
MVLKARKTQNAFDMGFSALPALALTLASVSVCSTQKAPFGAWAGVLRPHLHPHPESDFAAQTRSPTSPGLRLRIRSAGAGEG